MLDTWRVDISNGLSWNSHIDRITVKANRTLGFLNRNIKTKQSKVHREMAYNTLVPPQLEYASLIWDPYTKGKILQIEKVRRRAARWTSNNFDPQSSITGMLDDLGWGTLEQRRADGHLCLFYKIVYGLVAILLPDYIQPNPRVSCYCHSMSFRQVQTSRNFYKYTFFPLGIVQWNALPTADVCLPILDAFKDAVGRLQHSRR